MIVLVGRLLHPMTVYSVDDKLTPPCIKKKKTIRLNKITQNTTYKTIIIKDKET